MEFNSEFLNIDKNDDISLGQFAHAQYTVPGRYLLDITVNQRYFGSRSIEVQERRQPARKLRLSARRPGGDLWSQACVAQKPAASG
ncbi:FimD/PapC N-terminal domain-containing protein [Pseudomonas sp. S2_H08]